VQREERGRGRVRVETQAVEGKDPKWRPVVSTLYSESFLTYLKRKGLKNEIS
jgi:hypothetical protein